MPLVDDVFASDLPVHRREEARLKRPSRREVFEALYRTQYLQAHSRPLEALRRDLNDDYVHSGAQIAWEIWQAAHAHAIELAAHICERRAQQNINPDHQAIFRICASDIRALQSDKDCESER